MYVYTCKLCTVVSYMYIATDRQKCIDTEEATLTFVSQYS